MEGKKVEKILPEITQAAESTSLVALMKQGKYTQHSHSEKSSYVKLE